jgi:hypothetical protein
VLVHSLLGRRGLLGATTPEERAFCEWYARVAFRGAGAVIDLGCWLGSTTVPLARGMARRSARRPRTRVQAFDRFVWEEWMTHFVHASGADLGYRPGDDFRATLEAALGPLTGSVDIHTADLRVERWTGGPAELIVVDAMKSWELARNILQEFFSSLVSGGVIFHQDFAHYYTPWIHLIGYRLRDNFRIYYDVPNSDAVAFTLRSPLGDIAVAELASPATYTTDEATAAFHYSRGLVHPDKHPNITAAEAMFHLRGGDVERATAIVDAARREGTAHGDLATVEQLLRPASRDAANRSVPG